LKWGFQLREYLVREEFFIFQVQRKECPLKLLFVGLGALCQVLVEEREKGFIGKNGVLNKEASC
jgi:hypothetical protein